MPVTIGIDFGTTNSVVAIRQADGRTSTRRFGADALEMFRSVLCFASDDTKAGQKLRHAAGPEAIDAYLDDPLDSRLIMSMKTYLAQASFTETRIYGRRFTLENLIATFLRALVIGAGGLPETARLVVGRPVRFAGTNPSDDLGAARLTAAFAEAGMTDITLALEPEGAGYRFVRGLTRPANVLIGDFGGGTSDFSVLRFDPATGRVAALSNTGIGIAGDVFDYRIIDAVISPRLGKGDTYKIRGLGSGTALPVPPEYFSAFARWHLLSLMRTPKTLRAIKEVAAASAHPERLGALVTVIEEELGYALYRVVSGVKAELSQAETAVLRFHHRTFKIERRITRAEFETWIAPDLAQLSATVDAALAQANLTGDDIDHVFLTGGTAFVPAVRRIFSDRFGLAKIAGGGEFVSVAEGLALIGADRA